MTDDVDGRGPRRRRGAGRFLRVWREALCPRHSPWNHNRASTPQLGKPRNVDRLRGIGNDRAVYVFVSSRAWSRIARDR